MKPQILLLSFVLLFIAHVSFAQDKAYDKKWRIIDSLIEKKNRPKSALVLVKEQYNKAKAEKNEAQIIKSLVYQIGLQQENREEGEKSAIKEVEKEIAQSSEPATSILRSIQAGLYQSYFNNHRWQLYERTATVNFKKEDLATWGLDDFHKTISTLYLQSIKNETILKNTKLEAYDAIIARGNVCHLRPTLYDLLAHRALDYFKSDERDIKKPAYAFEITQKEAFAPAETFVRYKFTTKDSFSLKHKALLIYQELISFHLHDSKPDALIDVDIDRIEYVNSNSVADNKDSLYVQALQHLITTHPSSRSAYQAHYLLAFYHNELADKYTPNKDTAYRMERVKAMQILQRIVADSADKNNEGWVNSYNLFQQIKKKSISFTVEKVNLPAAPFRALITYKNLNKLYFRLIKASDLSEMEFYDDTEWKKAFAKKTVRTWEQTLPNTSDYQQHNVEVKIDGLPADKYLLIASSQTSFNKDSTIGAAQYFYVSTISYVNKGSDFFVLHRETGQPLVNAIAHVYRQEYDYNASKYKRTKVADYTTDKNGFFQVKETKDNRYQSHSVVINYRDDKIDLADNFSTPYAYDPNQVAKPFTQVFYFTDRSLYRPGQIVYFKGIAVTRAGDTKNLATGYNTTIYLRDANYQVQDSMMVTTNEYGSFNGKFTLPANVLNGSFTIRDKDNGGTASFSVEEYKRPKFHVDFEKLKESYSVGDTIHVKGTAKAYAGNNITGATVTYRVVRQPRFIYSWLTKWWTPPTPEMEITHGTTTTDAVGNYFINFAAIPDKSIDPKLEPVFDYRIHADVADINGETRSSETIVTVGYHSIIIKATLPEKLPADSLKSIAIRTENMAGEYQPSQVRVSITPLIPENRLIRKRLWDSPDQFVFSKEEFISYFPHDEYRTELDPATWKRLDVSWSMVDLLNERTPFSLSNAQFPPGYYEIEITTKDKSGAEVKDIHYIELYAATGMTKPDYLWAKGIDTPLEPGDWANLHIGSSASSVFVVAETEKATNGINNRSYTYWNLNNQRKAILVPATEQDRGGYGIYFFFIKDNRLYTFDNVVSVPWSNKELSIEYTTFRDKTLPGAEEKWSVKISGYKGEKAAAEMLASMYDASLDQFKPHQWTQPSLNTYYTKSYQGWNAFQNFTTVVSTEHNIYIPQRYGYYQYEKLITDMRDQMRENQLRRQYPGANYLTFNGPELYIKEDRIGTVWAADADAPMLMKIPKPPFRGNAVTKGYQNKKGVYALDSSGRETDGDGVADQFDKEQGAKSGSVPNQEKVQPRKNFNETAFFFPDLRTDKDGNISFSFTTPEALTRWKVQALAHTKDLSLGYAKQEMITQKELMVQPNAPRFLRQGDHLELTAKIVNLSGKEFTGQAQLELFDATTNVSVDGWFQNLYPNQYFTVAAGQSDVVKFPIEIPYQFNNALTWRITGRVSSPTGGGGEGASHSLSDGEEASLPVLTNKALVTETLPLPMRGSGTKAFKFDKLLQSGNSETLQQKALTVEYTSNPAWYAVQALPYLMEYPYECAEQTWNRYYANALASHIVNSAPRIKQIFEQWKNTDTAALLSNLQKNEELKSALLQETPWVLQAKSEEQQKKNIALLFDMVRMSRELKSNIEKLKGMQSSNGGFVWFKGGPDDRYITQYIATGIMHLQKLGVQDNDLTSIFSKALSYLDSKIKKDYDDLIKYKANLKQQQIGYTQIQYLYMRSFVTSVGVPLSSKTAFNYYQKQAAQYWMNENKYLQGMIALAQYRQGDKNVSKDILASLKETSITDEEQGMYWKENTYGRGWYWYQAPIETQSLLIEAFAEAGKDTKTVDDLRTWLIKNKQTNNWSTTKATAEACYALLLQGTDWLTSEPTVQIKLGSTTINSTDQKNEAGTGYFKKVIDQKTIAPSMGNVTVTVNQPINLSTNQPLNSPSWGAVYWQYFEDMDKITTASTPLKLSKKLFLEKNTDRGPVLNPVEQGTALHVGDKIKVRIELRVDRDMEYVHMKDMRASSLEPVNVLSEYKWQDGLGYYESTKDASTNFFFDNLRKGTYVFEYALFVTHTGNFSNGITTIQCMYAPEFTSHSEGVRITVE